MSEPSAPKLPRKADQIFATALRQLAELGYDGLTMEGIAEGSGVNKTTLYRWWGGKDDVLSAAMRHGDLMKLSIPDTGHLKSDILSTLTQVQTLLEAPHTRAIIAGVIDGSRPSLAELSTAFVDDRLSGHDTILRNAQQRGEIGDDVSSADLFHPLIGTLWIKVLLLRQSLSKADLELLIDRALNGALPR